MKKQNQFRILRAGFHTFLMAITFIASNSMVAQTTLLYSIDLENYLYTFNPGYPYEHVTEGVYKELLILPSTQASHLYLKVKGGDGGYNLKNGITGKKNGGGNGAVTSGLIQIGTGSGQIPPGSKLRLIPGQRGRSHFGESGSNDRGSGGGGGGGSAVVLLPAGKTNWDTESIVLMVAGGGGGGAVSSAGRPGNTLKTGRGGYDTCGNDLNNGGSSNNPGNTSNDASPGAAMDKSAGLGGASCNDGVTTNVSGAQKGWPTGGTGCQCICWGGFGFGGGGSGNTAGGGGGGYSGGGPGYYLGGGDLNCPGGAGGGGGGGSYVTSSLTVEQESNVGSGTTGSPSDGYITYGLLGTKNIKFAYNTNKCIDDYGSATSDGNNIQTYSCTSNSNQKWFINQDRSIRSLLNYEKCVDLSQSNTANGTNIQLWDCNSTSAQKWVYNGIHKTIHSGVNSNKCFDATNGSAYPNSNVNLQLWDCNYTSNNMKWTIDGATTVSDPANMKHIVPVSATGFAVHSHTGAESGSNIQLWTKDNTNTAEQWYFDGLAIKMRDHQNLCIDLSSSNTSNGNNIQLYNCNGSNAQKWLYDGMTKSIRSVVNPDKCMQIMKNADGVYGKRSNVQIYDCNGSDAQLFLIQE